MSDMASNLAARGRTLGTLRGAAAEAHLRMASLPTVRHQRRPLTQDQERAIAKARQVGVGVAKRRA